MKQRCLNPNDYQYKRYAPLGLEPDWHDFKAFLADVGERPEGMTLDRIDNSKGYLRGNVRWATPKEQARNSKNTRHLTFNGITKSLGEWADGLGLRPATLWERLKTMPLEKALTMPKQWRGKG